MAFGSRRMVLRVIGTVAACLLGTVIATGQAGQAQRPPMAEEVFKNIQILKGIPVDEFMDTMGMFSAATSLNCTHCHASDNTTSWDKYALDTPMKQTARRMLQMVNAINKENFKGVRSVTCYTCHNGNQRPKVVPSLTVQYSEPMEDPNEIEAFPNTGGPSANQVFDKYIQAIGGAQRLARVTSFLAKGTYSGYDTDQAKVPVEIFAKAPAQRTTIVHALFGDSVRTFDGRAGWIASADKPMPLMPLTGGNLDGARLEAMVSFPADLQQGFNQWRVTATVINDRDVRVLQGTNPKQPQVNFMFVKSSGLIVLIYRLVEC